MSHVFLSVLSCILITLLAPGTAPAPTLRGADVQEENYPTVQALKQFGQLLEERCGKRLSVEVFHSRQLEEEKESIAQCQAGGLDMVRTNLAPLIDEVPEAGMVRTLRQVLQLHGGRLWAESKGLGDAARGRCGEQG